MTTTLSQTIIKVDLCPSLTQNQQNIIIALHKPKVRQYFTEKKKGELITELIAIISKAVFYTGQKMEKSDLELNARNLAEYLNTHFPHISVWQISSAFENGSIGKYDKWMGLNLSTFIQWLNAYLNSEEVKEAVKIQREHLEELDERAKKISDLEAAEKNRIANEKMIAEYQANHDKFSAAQLEMFKNWAMRFFNNHPELFNYDNQELMQRALSIVKMSLIKVKYRSSAELHEAKNKVAEINMHGIENNDVKCEYKFLCVSEWILNNRSDGKI